MLSFSTSRSGKNGGFFFEYLHQLIGQVADVIFPALQLPEWTITFVVALLILGFPIAMIFAWVFDIGPGGIERTEPLKDRAKGIPRLERFAYLGLLAVAMGALAYFLFPRSMLPGSGDAGVVRDSIAVLPFANLSQDPDNDYFSDGMSEELLNLLARVPELRVASRTSSFAYKGRNVDVREVARQLGVDTVLEGSVRRSGDRVRITAQLIDAETGYHLWSSTYDRELQDIFAVQDEIARRIVNEIRLKLGHSQLIGQPEGLSQTENVDAYQLYLRGLSLLRLRGIDNLRRAAELFEVAPDHRRAHRVPGEVKTGQAQRRDKRMHAIPLRH